MWKDIFSFVDKYQKPMSTIAQVASPIITGWSAYKQSKTLEDQNDLLRQNYNYNKSINDREIAKENMNQENMTNAFSSIFGDGKKKKNLSDYYGTTNYQG